MECKCGFSFHSGRLRDYESYALVRDKDYRKFLRAESETLKCTKSEHTIAAVARSSRYVGTVFACPVCNRIILVLPGGTGEICYLFEERRI